jgi:predicted DNA-binding transcriptional regulator AlpA
MLKHRKASPLIAAEPWGWRVRHLRRKKILRVGTHPGRSIQMSPRAIRAHSDDEPLRDLDWLSEYLDRPKKSIYSMRLRGEGPPAYKIGQHLRWRKSEVDQWLAEQRESGS